MEHKNKCRLVYNYKLTMNNKGFTMIELLLYIAVSTIILLTVVIFLFTLLQVRIKNMVINEVEENGHYIMHIITQEIRNSESIISPPIATSSSSLTLNVSDLLKNPIVISLSNNSITMQYGSLPAVNLNTNNVIVQNLTFVNASKPGTDGIVRISFTLKYNNKIGRSEFEYTKTFTSAAAIR